ncbi:hypothetical protein G6F40_016893 [Rhizopus arrhizus]|nr:hypothetical protein G6F40_016893 [Rhizopus arrhizus]
MNSAFCACRTACTSNATRPCCASPFRTACWRRASCAPWRISRASGIAAMATSAPARTSSSIGRDWKTCRTSWRNSPPKATLIGLASAATSHS